MAIESALKQTKAPTQEHPSESIDLDIFQWKWIALFWFATILPMLLTAPHWPFLIQQDESYVSLAIIFLFLLGITVNASRYRSLFREIKHLNGFEGSIDEKGPSVPEDSIVASHWNNLKKMAEKDKNPTQDVLIEARQATLLSRASFPRLISSSLITLGLIGTIIGLVISLGGLQETIQQSAGNNLVQSIQGTLSGMGTAFYTTLIGAVLGGILLRFQNNLLRTYTTRFIASLSEITEIHLMPALRQAGGNVNQLSETKFERLRELSEEIEQRFDSVEGTLNQFLERISNGFNAMSER